VHYLAGTLDYRIHYPWYPAVLEGYSDVNWISSVDELYNMSGYIFTLDGVVVSWTSCKHIILTRSTIGAKLASLDTTTMETDWLREFLMDLPIFEKPLLIILMNCDNQMMIVKVNSSEDNMKSSRHITRQLKFVGKMKNSEVITLDYIHIEKNLADLFTKGLSHNVINAASKKMCLRPT
jgi:hypothetical protein